MQIHDLTVSTQGNTATARFTQLYSADALQQTHRKTLSLTRVDNRWLIVKETS